MLLVVTGAVGHRRPVVVIAELIADGRPDRDTAAREDHGRRYTATDEECTLAPGLRRGCRGGGDRLGRGERGVLPDTGLPAWPRPQRG